MNKHSPPGRRSARPRGFSAVELVVVVFILLVVAAMTVPGALRAVRNVQLRSSAGALAGLMQQARILAATKNANPGYAIRFSAVNGAKVAYIDLDGNGDWEANEPLVQFSGRVTRSTDPPATYVLPGDQGGAYPVATVLGFSPRGLPCPYVGGATPTCNTPAASYFVFYLTDGQSGWAAVAVSRSGRTRVGSWSGTSWQ